MVFPLPSLLEYKQPLQVSFCLALRKVRFSLIPANNFESGYSRRLLLNQVHLSTGYTWLSAVHTRHAVNLKNRLTHHFYFQTPY